MEKPSAYGQWTYALVIFLTVLGVATLYILGSGAVEVTFPDAASFFAFGALTIALGFLTLTLLWWGNQYGNLAALVFAILIVVSVISGFLDVSAGTAPTASLISLVPEFLAALGLIYTAFMAWRE